MREGWDAQAFEDLYRSMEKPLYNVVYRWVWHDAEAMDLVQEAFCRLWSHRGRVRGETAKPYLFRIAQNLAANHRRNRKIRGWVGLDAANPESESPSPTAGLQREQRRAAARAAIKALPNRYRRVLLLCRFSELSHEEIGNILSIPPGTVASRLHKAMNLLKKRMQKWKTIL